MRKPHREPDGRKARVRFYKGSPLRLQRHSGLLLTNGRQSTLSGRG